MFYLKLASTNLKKNHRGYLPFLISMLFLVAINTMTQVIVNNEDVPEEYLKKYIEDGAHMLMLNDAHPIWQTLKRIEAPLVQVNHEKQFIRHNPNKLAEYIFKDI